MYKLKSLLLLLSIGSCCISGLAQTYNDDNGMEQHKEKKIKKREKGFHFGLYVGTFFANNYSASVYDGYGLDYSHNKNTNFQASLLNYQINEVYGAQGVATGGQDKIANALGVQPGTWSFAENDMPQNMAYSIGLSVGLNTVYKLNWRQGLIMNLNATQLTINGALEIEYPYGYMSAGPQPAGNTTPYQFFPIRAVEQRLTMQLGYQQILGDKSNAINLFYEGGVSVSIMKMVSEQAAINSLVIDLTQGINYVGYNTVAPQTIVGLGIGLFGGFGINIASNTKWSAQLLYSPTLDYLNYIYTPKFVLEHSIGLRFYH